MIKLSARKICFALVVTVFALAPVAGVYADAPTGQTLTSRPIFMLKNHGGSSASGEVVNQSTSENWSGYAVTGSNNTYTSVTSSWLQPILICTPNNNSYSADWVGLDGYNDQTVEQIGTEANCINGQAQYYTWYEMYPQNPFETLTRLNVAPGNEVSATVTYNNPPVSHLKNHQHGMLGNGTFTLAITNVTTGSTYSTTQTPFLTVNRSSAEVIAEAPYSNGILPLAEFGIINFNTSEANSSALGGYTGLQAITMDDPYGMVATPSAFDVTNENFSITWSN
ncbi:MAG: G1 family glutamic endopeptidase [Candidatus Saccharimonadales bacterium]|jgi:hypothetical protein